MSEQYDVYRPAGSPAPASTSASGSESGWQVLVEFSNQGQSKPPTILRFGDTDFATRDEALAHAQRLAFDYEPPDPAMPQGRQVYRDGDGFLTVVKGAMTTFHFSTRVVRLVGGLDA